MKRYTVGSFEDEFAPHLGFSKKLSIDIPFEILSNKELSLNEKLVLGLDFSLKNKRGFNQLTNKKIGELLNLHPNIVGDCRKNLLEKQYLIKEKRKYFLTDCYKAIQESVINDKDKIGEKDRRNIKLPVEIYNNQELKTGEKLLWGEYNSISKGIIEYFARREYTANRIGVSVESISKWTKSLYEKNMLVEYKVISGYCTHRKIVITCSFDRK